MTEQEVPQFFQQPNPTTGLPIASEAKRAVYVIPGKDGEKDTEILVECAEGGGTVPRNASTFGQFNRHNLPEEMAAVARVAETVVDTLKKLGPGGMEIEFGIELGGEGGIPLITKHEAKANFKITLKWERADKE